MKNVFLPDKDRTGKKGGKILAVLLAVCLACGALIPVQQASAAQQTNSARVEQSARIQAPILGGIAASLGKAVVSYAKDFVVTRITYAITYSGNEDLVKLFKLVINVKPNPVMDLCKQIMQTVCSPVTNMEEAYVNYLKIPQTKKEPGGITGP